MESSRKFFNSQYGNQTINPSDTSHSKLFGKQSKGSRQGLEENLSSLETGRSTIGLIESSSSWYLDTNSTIESEDLLSSYLEQRTMVSEDFRSHEFRKTAIIPAQALPGHKVEVQCSKTELYDFHSQIVTALSFLEDGLNENFALVLGNLCLELYVRNTGIEIASWQDIRENFQLEQNDIMTEMQKAFDNFEWEMPNPVIIDDSSDLTSKRTKNSVQENIEWGMLELSMLKEEYKNKLQEADKTFQVNQNLRNNLKLNLIDLNKQQERLERTENNLKRKLSSFADQKRAFQQKVDQIKEKFSKFSSKFISSSNLVPEFETHAGIIKKNILSEEEIDKIQKEIAVLTTVLASSQSESETKDASMKINRLKTRLVCAKSSKLLQSSSYTREIHSLNPGAKEEEEMASEDKEIVKEVELIKAKLHQELEKVRERQKDMYGFWTRSFENKNTLDVVMSHACKLYRLEDELVKTQEDLQNERIRIGCKKKALSKNLQDFKCQQKCFEQGLKEIMMESKMILESI